MGTEQFVGTIHQVQTHPTDHTERPAEDPWADLSARLGDLGAALRDRYREVSEDAPEQYEVRDALRTLGAAAEALAASVGSALRDPEVRERLRDAAAGLVTAVGAAFEELGEELARPPRDPGSPPESP